jgi:hypothetical protein
MRGEFLQSEAARLRRIQGLTYNPLWLLRLNEQGIVQGVTRGTRERGGLGTWAGAALERGAMLGVGQHWGEGAALESFT